jgi:alkylation response protein AidB-like acyl-CoA dehydrogenase
VDFRFSELDRSFRDGVRAVLDERCSPAVIRAAWDAAPGATNRSAWEALAAMGALDALVPEKDGGLGLDERSVVLVFQEAGRAALPDPVVETAAVAAPLLGSGYVGSGAVVASDMGTAAAPGVSFVPWAADADQLLLGGPDGRLHLVAPGDARLEPVATVDGSRRACRVEWEPRPSSGLDVPAVAVTRARERGVLATAAQLVGLAERMLAMAVEYAGQREQFGAKIGSFQAVKHHLADAALAQEFSRPAVYRAAWSLATGSADAERDVSMAKAMASDAALATARVALQCHGAIGYTTEYDLHLYMKRAWALARAWGDPAAHRRRVAARLGV